MNKFKLKIGYMLLDIDDWFARKNIYFDWFSKDKDNHVSILCRLAFNLIF